MADQAPTSALYYPHWGISDPRFLFESLMFWDRLAVIGPDKDFKPQVSHGDAELLKEIALLNERFVSVVVPDDAAKTKAHGRLEAILKQEVPDWCTPKNLMPQEVATLADDKFLPETIGLLRSRGWAREAHRNNRDISVLSRTAANVCMDALANACASDKLPPVTASAADFAASCNLLLGALMARDGLNPQTGGPMGKAAQSEQGDDLLVLARAKLHTIGDSVAAKHLRKLRELREIPEIDSLRIRYREQVFSGLEALSSAPEMEMQLRLDELGDQMSRDQKQLDKELRSAKADWVVSRNGVIATLAAAGFGIASIVTSGAALAVAPALLAAGVSGVIGFREHRLARQAAFENHWTSWSYHLEQG